jgi:hypothetical protein
MSWSDIKARSYQSIQYQALTSVILESLRMDKDVKLPPGYRGFTLEFIKFLKRANVKESVSPWDVIILLDAQPHLAKLILEHKFDSFLSALRQTAKSDSSREHVLVTCFYDSYYSTKNLFRALLKVRRNVFIQADEQFIRKTFEKYPYLKDKKHLDHIVEKLDSVSFAYYLTHKGIQEVY